ncbi:hypothetical protein GKZ90_0005315 [Flavobacterium sp. MC2016-06]|uniref:energy transducer TonB n=1 Tax=Flavobacterium sp. MC2016-06 TaxID=2676308 RepID=UPI0012BA9471|nr:hypothetical protein [Flavobacterium sp. MC2016-06]MBU3857555.1 energy transducer TonB [Flavobacterium sp. MC2016-06]
MIKIFFRVFGFVLLLSCQNNSKPAQTDPAEKYGAGRKIVIQKPIKSEKNKTEDNEVYSPASVDVLPKYPDGITKFHVFLKKNYVIPQEVIKDESLAGGVFATIKIEKDGTLSEIKILRDFGYGSGKELERVLRLSPNWIPAMKAGKPVRCLYSIPYYVQ